MTPDRWLVLTVRAESEELRDELADALVGLGGRAVEEEGDVLTTYVPEPADPEVFVEGAADRLAEIVGSEPEIVWRWQANEDWSVRWKEGLAPRLVGPRITVTQPWNPVEESDDGIVIVIDPATAFGTGEHATTRGALRLLQDEVHGGERVLDVGAGSGILSIAAIRLGAASALAPESDEGSMETARENLERNNVLDRVELVHREVDPAYLAAVTDSGFDLVVANVLSGILVPLLGSIAGATRAGGRVILGGILESEAPDVVRAAEAAGLELVRSDSEEEWWTGLFARDQPRQGAPS